MFEVAPSVAVFDGWRWTLLTSLATDSLFVGRSAHISQQEA